MAAWSNDDNTWIIHMSDCCLHSLLHLLLSSIALPVYLAQLSKMANSNTDSEYGSDIFPDPVKLQIEGYTKGRCWVCGSNYAEACHVIGQYKPSYMSTTNGITLCQFCHFQYDKVDPGLVLLPEDLDYFIQFELNERGKKGRQSRVVPTAEDYKDYQISQGKVSAKDIGGLYRPVFLEDYALGGQLTDDYVEMLSEPRPWHGDPMGAICRSILVLGGPRECVVEEEEEEEETRVQLETLKHLYFFDHGLRKKSLSNTQCDDQYKRPWSHEDDDDHGEQKKLKSDKWEEDSDRTLQASPRPCDSQWSLGPESTSEQAIRRFASDKADHSASK